jgi:hypothetical protein
MAIKLTESRLRQIIREEARKLAARRPVREAPYDYDDDAPEGDYWDREFDEDSDDEYDAIKDYAAMTGQDKEDVFRDRMAGRYGRR